MRKATIIVSLNDKSFETSFEIDEFVQEYQIADEAYRVGLLFANTQIIATYGHRVSEHKLAEILRKLEYDYTIEEVK